jgi:hypothetical protein
MSVAARRVATSLLVLVVALVLFLYGCWTAAADAQGAVGFIFLGPLSSALALGALLLAREAVRLGAGAGAWAAGGVAGAVLALQLTFFGCAFTPACRSFPHAVVSAVSSAYTAITGVTPYEGAQRR